MFSLFLRLLEKGPRFKWALYKHESDKNYKCLSVGNFVILSASLTRLQPKTVYEEPRNIY